MNIDLLVTDESKIRTLTLNRVSVRNAISAELACRLADAVEEAGDLDDLRVIVIQAAGPDFSSGYDVAGGSYGAAEATRDARRLRSISRQWERVLKAPLPVIAAVHGRCLAGGSDLAAHCDLVVTADDSVLGFPAVRSMGVALTQMWLYQAGPQWAKRLLLTGDTVTGRLAAQIGLALQSVPADQLTTTVRQLAERIALVDREMLIGNKYVVNHGLELMGRAALQDMAAVQDAMAHTTTAARAFVDRAKADGLRAALQDRDAPFGAEPLDVHPPANGEDR